MALFEPESEELFKTIPIRVSLVLHTDFKSKTSDLRTNMTELLVPIIEIFTYDDKKMKIILNLIKKKDSSDGKSKFLVGKSN